MTRSQTRIGSHHACRGSLMVELALTLVVLGVLATISSALFSRAERDRQGQSAAAIVQAARQAVLDFALTQGRLPCPDLSGAGTEGDASGHCPAGIAFARLPVHTLGLGEQVSSGALMLRYGIARPSPDADLSILATGSGSGSAPASPAHALLARAERAVTALGTAHGQPYIPAADAAGRAVDCATPAARPAFVISMGEPADVGASTCFPVPPRDRGALTAMGPLELAGWLRSKL